MPETISFSEDYWDVLDAGFDSNEPVEPRRKNDAFVELGLGISS